MVIAYELTITTMSSWRTRANRYITVAFKYDHNRCTIAPSEFVFFPYQFITTQGDFYEIFDA